MSDSQRLADLLLPDIDKAIDYYENMYPPRELPEGSRVTRVAPSPTGYLHIGTLYISLIDRIAATQSGGVFYTRIEDTDKKREVAGGIDDIINGLIRYGIEIDEGFVAPGEQKGEYGPYQQSKRAHIYQCYAKHLIAKGLAYPCFCTEEELEKVRKEQEALKLRTGYYGKWAKHRDITFEEAKKLIEEGRPYVIRLKSPGKEENRIYFDDGIKGRIEMPENDEDFVILKSDGIPTYHFAHVVDDHLMRTTHVIRGDEWVSSTPKHLQLFKLFGFKPPKYIHVAPIMKLEGGSKRKISKRKDPEAAVYYYYEKGYPKESVLEYLMTIANSDYEDFRRANPDEPFMNFKFSFKKMSVSGALFDGDKLNDVSRDVISRMKVDRVVDYLLEWSAEYNKEFYRLISADIDYTKKIFNIDRDVPKPRKDIAFWQEAVDYSSYFFDETFKPCYDLPENIDVADAVKILDEYIKAYAPTDNRQEWFEQIKAICPAVGYASETKEYRKNPDKYKGYVGDASTVIRIAVTGRRNTPDLCQIMDILGYERCLQRLKSAREFYKNLSEGLK
ncbi:MAG TPA: glutamate--tRNA ligase [Clostridiales bacterium]|nr:glutamate--tRNA ligase [Clostridiales bacterium]